MAFFDKIFGDPNAKYLKKIQPTIDKINNLESHFESFSDSSLKTETEKLREQLKKQKSLDDLLPNAFALVREASKRNLEQKHFDVQLIAGIALHQGKIIEMKTGEGKTLAATLPIFLNALDGKGVHVITVNDYLAKRDTVWMGQIYYALGLSIGCIAHNAAYIYDPEYKFEKPQVPMSNGQRDKERDLVGGFRVIESYLRPVSRKQAYLADITYGTNHEFGFDYLRDNIILDFKQKAQRDFHYAIIDEVDSILIDEARTPLIISGPTQESTEKYYRFAKLIASLKTDEDYVVDERLKSATFTEQGQDKVVRKLNFDPWAESDITSVHQLESALKAKSSFFTKDKQYIVKNGQIIIVDEFTGRLMPGRRYSGGLHQAIEAKEGVEVQAESKTLASITFQNYFRLYKKLSGMTGTALTSAEEFEKVYKLEIIAIPTNKPMIRKDLADKVYKTEMGKFKAIIKDVKARHRDGQPVLIGTSSIEKNELLAKILEREGISCELLNAKHHQREGEIIAQAGREGQVTVATNMAGRGVDIILGGNPPDPEEAQKVKDLGGLYVIGAQRHEARRIDNQLRGRSGRQGDMGSSCFFISLEDDILRIFGGDKIKKLIEILKIPEDQPIEAKILSGAIEKAQGRVEGLNFDLRKHILEYDDVASKHRNKIYSLRREILTKNYEQLKTFILEIVNKEIEKIIQAYQNADEVGEEKALGELKTILPLTDEVSLEIESLKNLTENYFQQKEEKEGKENMERILRFVCLRTIDLFWSEHLETMDYLKDSVKLRAYGGRDPLVEYKSEGHKIFQQVQKLISSQIARTVFKLSITS